MFGAISEEERGQLIALRLTQSERELKEVLSQLRLVRDGLPAGDPERENIQQSIDIIIDELRVRGVRPPIHISRNTKIGIGVVALLFLAPMLLK